MKIQKMVVRLKNKSLLKGTTCNFSPLKASFHLILLSGELVTVYIEKMKAAFFVKRFDGDRSYNYTYKDFIPWGGNKVKVDFADGETMIGYTQHHSYAHQGFFVTPADLQGNNERVFIMSSATSNVTFL